jgi:hypothetical protein
VDPLTVTHSGRPDLVVEGKVRYLGASSMYAREGVDHAVDRVAPLVRISAVARGGFGRVMHLRHAVADEEAVGFSLVARGCGGSAGAGEGHSAPRIGGDHGRMVLGGDPLAAFCP